MDRYLIIHIRKNSLTPTNSVTWNLDKLTEMYAYSSKNNHDIYVIYKLWDNGVYTRVRMIINGVISCDNSDYINIRELFGL